MTDGIKDNLPARPLPPLNNRRGRATLVVRRRLTWRRAFRRETKLTLILTPGLPFSIERVPA